MEIESNKVRSVVNEDRFSSLPNELIHQILSCFDTKFAVQTSLLSSRWKPIWKSMPWLDFSSREFDTLHKFSKFVTHVLSHRNHQVEVASVKLYFHGAASQAFVRKIANYAFSHNVQELTVSSFPKKNHEFPPCFFSSQTLKQLSLSFHPFAPCVTPKTPWDFPALTTLDLFDTMLCDDNRESFEPFSKCVNLKNLILRTVTVHAKVFDIITPQVTKLTLIDFRNSRIVNVIAPQLENLTVINSYIDYMKAPLRLSYLCYSGDHYPPQWFKDCFQSLNEVTVSLYLYSKNKPYKEKAARETINMLQELHSARCLTLNMDIIECISSFPDLISHHPSPFSNLISLTINSNLRHRLDAHKLKMSAEARNFFLENSPSATFIMDLPEPPPTKAMKAKLAREKRAKVIAEFQAHMTELQTLLDQENKCFIERQQAQEEMKTALEYLLTELQIRTDEKTMQSEFEKKAQIEELLARLKVLNSAYLREIVDMSIQEYDKVLSFCTKTLDIRLLLEALPKRQMAEMEARYSPQLEETETLSNRLCSTSKDLFSYVKQKMEAFEKYKSDNISTFQDPSSSAVIPAPSSPGINPMP